MLLICFLLIIAEIKTDTETDKNDKIKKFNEKIKNLLKNSGIGNKSEITKEEFRTVFGKLFEDKEKKVNKGYINSIFDKLVKDDNELIKVDKIIEYFEPSKMLFSMKGLSEFIDFDKIKVEEDVNNNKEEVKEDVQTNSNINDNNNADL